MEVFKRVKETVLSIISEAVDSDDHVAKLVDLGGILTPEVVATSFQLMERGKVRELMIPRRRMTPQKPRVFEDFHVATEFDWKSEWRVRREQRKREMKETEFVKKLETSFVEIEHARKKESLQFLYPSIHYCPCQYFQSMVLEKQEDWICVHLLAYYFSKSFEKMEKIECRMEIIQILKKMLVRAVCD